MKVRRAVAKAYQANRLDAPADGASTSLGFKHAVASRQLRLCSRDTTQWQAAVSAACRHAAAPQRQRPGPEPPPGRPARPSARCRRRSGSRGRPSAPAPPPSPPESTTKPNRSTSVLGPLAAAHRGADTPPVAGTMHADDGAPILPSPPQKPPP